VGALIPAFAAVRPRVVVAEGEDPRLLEDVVAELADEESAGVAWVVGGPRSGKTTALCHLSALFAHDERFHFVDDTSVDAVEPTADRWVIAASGFDPRRPGVHLALADWHQDELIEYLLTVHHDACGSVITRLGAARDWSWTPELALIVLEGFAADESLADPAAAIVGHVRGQLSEDSHYRRARQYCLAAVRKMPKRTADEQRKLLRIGTPPQLWSLLSHELVQLALAAEQAQWAVSVRRWRVLKEQLPLRLVQQISELCRDDGPLIKQLNAILASRRTAAAHPMAASILHAAETGWRPGKEMRQGNLAGGYFRGAQWQGVQLQGAKLDGADLTSAVLDDAELDAASLAGSVCALASFRGASLRRIKAPGASFARADLRGARLAAAGLENANFSRADLSQALFMKAALKGANLAHASLVRADLTLAHLVGTNLDETDLSYAELRQADLTEVDLRTAEVVGADLEKAWLRRANLEGIEWTAARLAGADLRGAHLTGSRLADVNLRGADLREAGLGEIDWPRADLREADLRGATFHMGSSRSGLVNSPIACEGSKTGFYTDELEEIYFRPPEEVRKANLQGADLRGAKIDSVDFYLVDLRDARLAPAQLAHARRTGAILRDED
jgi:uncharacterized protein YjbI with pentapeptide repeats